MPIFKATDLTDAKAITFSAKDLTDAAPANSLEDMTRTSTPTPAQAARARLSARGLTPEAVKSGHGISPLPSDVGPSTPIVRPILQGLGVPTSLDELKQGALHNAPNLLLPGSVQTGDFFNDLSTGHVPIVGRTAEALSAPTEASMQNRPQTPDENAGAIRAAAGTIPTLAMMSPTFRGAVGKTADFAMPKTAANLINHWLGKGAIDTDFDKNAGRGISQAKIVASSAEGVHSGVKEAISNRQTQLKQMLDTPLANAPAIDGNALLKKAFDTPPLNMPRTALQGWNEMRANIATKMQEMTGGTNQLTPVQADALKNEIDVNFGRLSTDATELNLNQKSGNIRRMFDHAVDKTVPGYKELNDHLADLHHADKVLTQKIAENAEAPPFSLNPKALVRGALADTFSPSGSGGTRPGLLTTPGRTALASILSQPPNIPRTVGGMVANPAAPTEGSFSAPPPGPPAGGFNGGTTYTPPNLNPKLLPPPSGMTVTPQGTAIPQLDMSTGMASGVPELPRIITPRSASGAGAPTNIDPLHSAIQAGDAYLGELKSGSRPSGVVPNGEPPTAIPTKTSLPSPKTEAKVADLTSRPAAVRPEIVEANRQHNSNAIKILNNKYPLGSDGTPPRVFKASSVEKPEAGIRTPETIFADIQKVDSALSDAVDKNLAARELANKTMRGLEATPNGGRPKGSATVEGEPVEFVSTKEATSRKNAIVAAPQELVRNLQAQRDSLYKEMETAVQPKADTQVPTKPTHVTEGTQVSGIDEQGNLVSGNLEKLYPVVGEDGQPVWKGTILDLRNSRTMDLPADRIFDRLSGPPKSAVAPKPRTATAPPPAPVAAPKSKLDTLLDQFDDEIPDVEDPKQAELERTIKSKAPPPPKKAALTSPPLDKGEAAKKAVQDWLDKKALMDMEEQLGAGKSRKPKGKR